MNTISMKLQADELIRLALQEDISSEDVTTNSVMKEAVEGEVQLICKQDGIVAGLDVFKRVFELLDENTKTEFLCKDGDAVKKGQLMGTVTGDIRVLLSGERVALNYLQRMSGIATYTHTVSALLKGTKTKLLDTRKTTPNNRIFEKYSVFFFFVFVNKFINACFIEKSFSISILNFIETFLILIIFYHLPKYNI